MADPFIGQIIMFGGNFAPRGWAKCDGQLLQISMNQALFSILGTTFGGDGRTSTIFNRAHGGTVVLEEINVRSSVQYTMKVHNRDESLEA